MNGRREVKYCIIGSYLRMLRLTLTALLSFVLMQDVQACPTGWFSSPVERNLCFNFTASRANFFLAFETCQRMRPQATLASVSNVFENAAMRAFALTYDEKPVAWIGLNDVAENGQWNWLDNNPTTFTRWAPGYPKTEANSLCVALDSTTGFWVNKDCATPLPFFCSICSDKNYTKRPDKALISALT
uniref:C-type lectin domain-containing protein n=1 Tax=Parascaris univalens TaxID=6257 RepID=A0A915B3R8_PARUN